jgi:hypothetical protein
MLVEQWLLLGKGRKGTQIGDEHWGIIRDNINEFADIARCDLAPTDQA